MSALACCHEGCGASVCFTPEVLGRLKRTHEWWVCPFGHRQQFVDETNEEREIRFLKRARDNYRRFYEEVEEEFGTCPFCDWRSRSATVRRWLYMLRHFDKAHRDLMKQGTLVWSYREVQRQEAAS